jgi:hypothetical protein
MGNGVKIVHSPVGFSNAFVPALPQITSDLLSDVLNFLVRFREDLDASSVEKITCLAPKPIQSLVNSQWFVETVFDTVYIPIEFASNADEVNTLLHSGGFDSWDPSRRLWVLQFAGRELVCWQLQGNRLGSPFQLKFSLMDLAHQLLGVDVLKAEALLNDHLLDLKGHLNETKDRGDCFYIVGEDVERLMDLWESNRVLNFSRAKDISMGKVPFQKEIFLGTRFSISKSEEEELQLMHRSLSHIIEWLGKEGAGPILPSGHSYLYSKLLEIVD